MNGTEAFFHAMAPVLTANVLTVAFIYSFWAYCQKEKRQEIGGGHLLSLLIAIFSFMLYGLYTWGVYPVTNQTRAALQAPAADASAAAGIPSSSDYRPSAR